MTRRPLLSRHARVEHLRFCLVEVRLRPPSRAQRTAPAYVSHRPGRVERRGSGPRIPSNSLDALAIRGIVPCMVDGNEHQSSGMTSEQVDAFLRDFLEELDRAATASGAPRGSAVDEERHH